jgi:hypothetical protein
MTAPNYLVFHDDGTVSSSARTCRSGHGKARLPVNMRELLKAGRWLNGDPLSANDFYEVARRLRPGQEAVRAKELRMREGGQNAVE